MAHGKRWSGSSGIIDTVEHAWLAVAQLDELCVGWLLWNALIDIIQHSDLYPNIYKRYSNASAHAVLDHISAHRSATS
jgi:hypothetical protein